ncbi:MAG: hypothetical protein OIF54_10080 [Cohaesibacter sp.]|nr:hypothetical protein [Cohaesibacter sp.]
MGAKLISQPLAETTLHEKHPSHIWDVIWMPLARAAPKFARDWVKPKVNSTNWREFGGIPLDHLMMMMMMMMMFADDAFSKLILLFCKTCQLHAAGVGRNC